MPASGSWSKELRNFWVSGPILYCKSTQFDCQFSRSICLWFCVLFCYVLWANGSVLEGKLLCYTQREHIPHSVWTFSLQDKPVWLGTLLQTGSSFVLYLEPVHWRTSSVGQTYPNWNEFICFVVNVVQLLSHVRLSVTPWTACRTPGFPVLHDLPEFAQTHVWCVRDAIKPSSHPLSPLLLLTSIFPTYQGLFQWVSSCIRGPKYWSFSFSISPSNDYSGLISFRTDWFDLLAVQGILKILL